MSIVAHGPFGSYLGRWIALMHRHASLVALGSVIVTAIGLAYVVAELGINTSTTDMIDADVPFRQASAAYDDAFPQFDNNIVVVVDGPTREATQEASDRLAEALLAKPDQFESVNRPGGERFFRENGLLFLDLDELFDLADRLSGAEPLLGALAVDPSLRGLVDILQLALEQEDPGETRELERAIGEIAEVADAMAQGRNLTLSWANLLSGEGTNDTVHRQFVLLRPILDFGSLTPAAIAIDTIRATGAELGISEKNGLRLRITGSAAIEQEELESVKIGSQTAGYLSLVLVTILLVLAMKSVRLILVTVATLLMGLIWTTALATLVVGELNLISVAFAVLFIGLGVDFSIHFVLRYLETSPEQRAGPDGLIATAGGVGGALALSAVCAAAGFFAFLPTDYVGLAELGLIAGIGMFVALFANMTILPAFLALARPKTVLRADSKVAVGFANFLQRRARPILGLAGLAALASLALVPSMIFDFNPINLRDPKAESVATFLDLAKDPDSSSYSVDLLAPNLEAARALTDALDALPQVGNVISITSFVPKNQDRKLAIVDELAFVLAGVLAPSDPEPPATPQENAALLAAFLDGLQARSLRDDGLGRAAARLAVSLSALGDAGGAPAPEKIAELERRLLAHVPYMFARLDDSLYADTVSLDTLPDEIVNQWVAADGRMRLLVQPATGITNNEELQAFSDAVVGVAPGATGMPVIVTEAGRVILNAFLTATVIAFVAIIIILFAMLRRPSDVALVLVPLVLAASLTIAVSVTFGLAFNFANIIVLPLLLGLGIASAIHLVMRWRKSGGTNLDFVASSTPRAVFFSAMTTVAAFGSLAVSGHLGMRSMGILLAVALMATMVSTLIVLPSLMAVFASRAQSKKEIHR